MAVQTEINAITFPVTAAGLGSIFSENGLALSHKSYAYRVGVNLVFTLLPAVPPPGDHKDRPYRTGWFCKRGLQLWSV